MNHDDMGYVALSSRTPLMRAEYKRGVAIWLGPKDMMPES